MRFPFLVMAAVLISSSFLVQAKMFKWVDENGQMHFGDKIPQKYQVKEHEELNDQGVSLKQLAAAKTPEEEVDTAFVLAWNTFVPTWAKKMDVNSWRAIVAFNRAFFEKNKAKTLWVERAAVFEKFIKEVEKL